MRLGAQVPKLGDVFGGDDYVEHQAIVHEQQPGVFLLSSWSRAEWGASETSAVAQLWRWAK